MHHFRSPVPKRCSLPHGLPLPVFRNDSTEAPYEGIFNGLSVAVEKHEDMHALYTMGYFGKGSLSQSYPSYCKKLKRSNKTEFASVDCDPSTLSSAETPDDSAKPTEARNTEFNPLDTIEQLHLSPEEAFFLSFALNCLNVYFDNRLLDHRTLWTLFQDVRGDFVERYVAYHYFRAKGWVVKSGIKYGGDFVLYKEGPPFFHSSYVVFILCDADRESSNRCSSFLTYYRAIEVAKKELLICRVKRPDNFEKDNLDYLRLCQVSEFHFKRWVPSENRHIQPRNINKPKQEEKSKTVDSSCGIINNEIKEINKQQ